MFEWIGMRRLSLGVGALTVVMGGLVFARPGLSAPQSTTPTADELAIIQARTEHLHQRAFARSEEAAEADSPRGALAETPPAASAATAVPGPGSAASVRSLPQVSAEEAVKRAAGLSGQVRSVSLVQRQSGSPLYVIVGARSRVEVDATTGDAQEVPER